jgi:hypothetical protein
MLLLYGKLECASVTRRPSAQYQLSQMSQPPLTWGQNQQLHIVWLAAAKEGVEVGQILTAVVMICVCTVVTSAVT